MRKKESGGLGPKHKKVLGGHCPKLDLTRNLHGKPRDALGLRCKQCALPNDPKAQGSVRPEDRHLLPAVRRGVML